MGMRIISVNMGGDVLLHKSYLPSSLCSDLLQELLSTNWSYPHGPFTRGLAWFGTDPYLYKEVVINPSKWGSKLEGLRLSLESTLGVEFKGVLANRYEAKTSLGWHSDDESNRTVIPVLSLGAPRTLLFRHKERKYEDIGVPLSQGDLLIMAGTTQENWLHSLPKSTEDGVRVSLTFRSRVTSPSPVSVGG